MNRFLRNIAYLFTVKHLDEKKIKSKRICLYGEDLSFSTLSTNSIISFYYEGDYFYFRECPKEMKFNDYFIYYINRFFFMVDKSKKINKNFSQRIPISISFSTNTVGNFRAYIDRKVKCRRFLKELSKADVISEKIGFNIWKQQKYDKDFFNKFGLDELPEDLYEISVSFLWYVRSIANNYRRRNIVRGKKYSYFSAVRSLSSKIVADELGLGHMIPDGCWCELVIDDRDSLFGILCNEALGKRMADTVIVNPCKIQKELMNLNVLDAILLQTDHGPNNYNVDLNNAEEQLICAYDNDNPFTLFPLPTVKLSLSGCSPLVSKKGIIDRPYFDLKLAMRIKTTDYNNLLRKLKPYLNSLQRASLLIRVHKINRAISKTDRMNNGFLLREDQWNDRTAQSELDNESAVTYLSKAYDNCLGKMIF